jgi:hypothetical protein
MRAYSSKWWEGAGSHNAPSPQHARKELLSNVQFHAK